LVFSSSGFLKHYNKQDTVKNTTKAPIYISHAKSTHHNPAHAGTPLSFPNTIAPQIVDKKINTTPTTRTIIIITHTVIVRTELSLSPEPFTTNRSNYEIAISKAAARYNQKVTKPQDLSAFVQVLSNTKTNTPSAKNHTAEIIRIIQLIILSEVHLEKESSAKNF